MAREDSKFEDLTKPELIAVAEAFAVDVNERAKKETIIQELGENGVTFAMYRAQLGDEDPQEFTPVEDFEAPAPAVQEEKDDETVVVKMTRKNHSYEIRGYRFTQQHPYALVSEDDADFMIEVDGGFRMASPRELREFYPAS